MTSFLVNDSVCLDAGFVSGALSLREQVQGEERPHLPLPSRPHLLAPVPDRQQLLGAPGFNLQDLRDPRSDRVDEEPPLQQPHLARLHLPAQRPHAGPEARRDPGGAPFQGERALRARDPRVAHRFRPPASSSRTRTGSVGYSSDTAPTERFWEVANRTKNLKALIVETSFPNELQDLANVSGHLTPQTLDLGARKLSATCRSTSTAASRSHLAQHPRPGPPAPPPQAIVPGAGKTYKF